MNWNLKLDVIREAKKLGPDMVVFKHPGRKNYNITHVSRTDRYEDAWVYYSTSTGPIVKNDSIKTPVNIGRLPTMNQDEYPGLGAWWLQIRDADGKVLMRVYGESVEQVKERAKFVTDSINWRHEDVC